MSDEMREILQEVGHEGVTDRRSIRLTIRHPNVPCLDLVDLPGLVANGDSAQKTEDIITKFVNVSLRVWLDMNCNDLFRLGSSMRLLAE